MPRPPRDLAPGIQHIGVSAAGPANYFRDEIDHMTWTRLFVRTLDRHGWVCVAMCQLSTHWHALVDIPDGSLARGMHELNSEYGKRFQASRAGRLPRPRSLLVASQDHLGGRPHGVPVRRREPGEGRRRQAASGVVLEQLCDHDRTI
jgi:hypothetical protein